MHFTLKYLSVRCKYFTFPNPYLRIRMLLILLYVLGLVMPCPYYQDHHTHLQIGFNWHPPYLRSARCISKIIFQYLMKYSLLCLNGSIPANCLSHTYNRYSCTLFIVSTSRVQWYSSRHPPYLDVWQTSNSIAFSPSCGDPGVSLECRPIQILGEDICLIDSTQYPLDHQYTGFPMLHLAHIAH